MSDRPVVLYDASREELHQALIGSGRAREYHRLAPLIGRLVGVIVALVVMLAFYMLGWR